MRIVKNKTTNLDSNIFGFAQKSQTFQYQTIFFSKKQIDQVWLCNLLDIQLSMQSPNHSFGSWKNNLKCETQIAFKFFRPKQSENKLRTKHNTRENHESTKELKTKHLFNLYLFLIWNWNISSRTIHVIPNNENRQSNCQNCGHW